MGRKFRREETYVYLWLIHVDIWQKPSQYCKVIILQLKIKLKKKRRTLLYRITKSGHRELVLRVAGN